MITAGIFDWKLKAAIALVICTALFFWHRYEVETEVFKAEQEIHQQYSREIFKLKDRANEESTALKARILYQQKEKQRELEIANRKYNDILEWVRNLPSTSGSGVSTNTGNAEDKSGEVIGELRRRNAEALARYGFRTEELKIELLACYKQYDEVRDSFEKFKADNASRNR